MIKHRTLGIRVDVHNFSFKLHHGVTDERFCVPHNTSFLGEESHESMCLATYHAIRLILQNQCAQHLAKLRRQLTFHDNGICFVGEGVVSESSCQYMATEKTLKGYQKMAEAQLIHLTQSTRYRDLIGEPMGPQSPLYMQKRWINEKTSGYFRWHQNDQSGCLTEMCN